MGSSASAVTPTPLPLYLRAEGPAERNRGTALIRILMVIPQYIVLFFVGIAAFVVVVIGWFAALITGELPAFAHDFLSGVLRWEARVHSYLLFLTDEYPPFSLGEEPQYPVRVAIPPRTPLNRLAVLLRIFIAIPGAIVGGVMITGAWVVSIASWFMIVFTGAMPPSIYEAVRVAIRYYVRFIGYYTMLTPEYSWGPLGDPEEGAPGQVAAAGAGTAVEPAAPDAGWLLRLSSQGRTTTIVLIVIGAIVEIIQFARR